jgi:spermidine/putrescine transport system substrate-binding protein
MLARRSLLRLSAAALAAPALGRTARGTGRSVTVLAYAGLIPPSFKKRFEAETGIEIRLQPQFSQAPELNLLLSERDAPTADICTVAGSRLHQFHGNGVITPLDTGRLRHWARIEPIYRDGDWLRVDGQVMGVPLTVSCERLITNLDFGKAAAESWGDLFDRRYRGHATYVIEDMLQMTMLWQGGDGSFASYVAAPEKAQAAVNAARDHLIRTKPQVVKYYEDGAELVQLLTGEDAWIAQFYAGAPTRLVLDGLPYRITVPREGTLGSVYNFGLVKNGPNPDDAYRLLDALLADPGIGAAMTRASGYPSCFTGAEVGLSDLEKQAFLLSRDDLSRIKIRGFEGQALNSRLIDRAVEDVKAA